MRKRCWKTVLSAILASAMLITSTPANLSMTVQAAEPGVEDTLSVLTEQTDESEQQDDQTGQVSGEDQDVQNPVGTNAVDTTDDAGGDDAGTDQAPDTQTGNTESGDSSNTPVAPNTDDNNEAGDENLNTPNTEVYADLSGAEAGAVADGKEITFTCKPTDGFFGSYDNESKTDIPLALTDVTNIKVRGETTPGGSWDNLVTLDKGEDGVWTGTWTAPSYGTYTYQFQANDNAYYMLYNNKVNLKITLKDPDVEETYAGPTIDYNPESSDPGAVTFYYPLTYMKDGSTITIDSIYVKGGWISDWSDHVTMSKGDSLWSVTLPTSKLKKDSTIEYGFGINVADDWSNDNANPNNGNSKLHRNPEIAASGDVTLFYYPSHGVYPTKVELKYRKKGDTDYTTTEMKRPESGETAVYQVTLTGLEEAAFEYYFDVDGTKVEDTNNATTGEFSKVKIPEEDPTVKSPVTADGKTTFYYYGPTAKSVQLAGNMTTPVWGDGAKDMEYNAETGYWSIALELEPGSYEYKFIVDNAWIQDPLNPNPAAADANSKFVVAGLQVPPELWVKRGGSRALPSTMKLDDGTQLASAAVTYEVSAESKEKYGDKITLTPETKDGVTTTTLNVAADFPAADKSFTLTASAQGNSSEVTMLVADATYMYTIYYYDPVQEHTSVDNAALWLWQTSAAGATKQTDFDAVETLADGNTWLKKTIELGYTDLSFKSKAYGSWDWEDTLNKKYVNGEEKAEVTLYAITDDSKVYTELPEIVVPKERYLVVEYKRETKKDGHWQLRTWNNGFGTTAYDFVARDDETLIAQIPVKSGVDSISYNIRRTEPDNEWAEKDGNDYNCPMPADQNIVKIKMEEGKGITYTYPYNTGYEIDTKEKEINFYYRDDEAFLAGSEGGYEDVTLELIAPKADDTETAADEQTETSSVQTVKMTYDAEEQRYEWTLDQLVPGDHYYRYARKKTASDAAEYVLDAFNELKETVAETGTEYSVLKYDLLDVEMEAEIQNDTMDYNDNNVLSIKVNAKDSEGESVEDAEELKVVEKATVDLSALGGGVVEIDPELLAVTIAVKQGTSAGVKTLPITIYDVYNNEYKTDVKVTVTDRGKGSDFDWDEAVVYFAVTDRFFDGNSSNNDGGVSGSYDPDTNGGLNSSYHGGDFAGLTQKLDYLQDLGVNTIWITPIVENQTVANSVDDPVVKQAWGYTGYWTKDFTKIDAHLGTEAEFSALLDAAHAKGMKVMVDVVLNHTGYGDDITNYYNSNFKNEDGETIKMLRGDDEIVPGSDQMSSLSGLPDFRTEDPEVRELVVEWQSNWISRYPIDYYRVDTVKHVDDTTWSAFKNALTEINPDFKMIGEWAGAGYATDTGMLNTGRMDALLDFDFPAQAANFVTGDLSGVEGFLSARNGAIDNTASLGAFLSNHDQQGFIHRLTDEKHKSEDEAKQLALVAASLQLTAKGQVYIYYGEEIGESDGEENYPYQTNRKDFDWSKVTDDNQALTHYKKMLSIRNMYSELFAKGSRNTISADNASGLDVFTRSYGGTTLTVALNIKDQEQTYTLSGQTPGMAVVDYYSGTQYPVDESGNAVITIPAAADGGTVVLGTENFKIDLPTGGGMQIRSIPDQTYTGLSIKLPEDVLQVYDGTTRLTADVDYTVNYKNNKAVGTATVTIKGKGNYKGSETAQFNIVPKNVAELDIVYKDILIANGSVQKPLSKITNNGKKLTTKEYQAVYYQLGANGQKTQVKGVKEVGEYEMVITGQKNYAGTVTKKITVTDQGTYMTKLKITLEYSSTDYTGSALEPTVTVKDGNKVLTGAKAGTETADTEYTVSYFNNTNVGTANVIITGVSAKGYYGSMTKTFKIKGTELSKVAQVDAKSWQAKLDIDPIKGNAEQANAVLTAKKGQSVTLTKGKDYTVSYTNNTKPGTATMIFTGAGKYTGTIKKTFKINAIKWVQTDVEDGRLIITVDPTAPYSRNGATPGVTVTYKNKRLAAGKDYKLTYKNNKAVADANATKAPFVEVTGIGSFAGKVKSKTFGIVKADLSDWKTGFTVTVPDVVYSDRKGEFASQPVVKAADGTYLTKGTDYKVEYFNKVNGDWEKLKPNAGPFEKGTRIKAEVSGNGNYTGTVSKEYKIVQRSIRKATIIAKAQTYTGKAITLDASDFSKAKIGRDQLVYGVDYEIVPGSYEKNVNKGTASVTVRGIGNYGDEKKVTFRITSSIMRWWWNLFS